MVRPIGGGAPRKMSVIIDGKEEVVMVRLSLFKLGLGVIIHPPVFAGMIVVPRWEEMERLLTDSSLRHSFRYRPDHLKWEGVKSIHHAYRQTWHILLKHGIDLYTGERRAMIEAATAARRLNTTVLGLLPGLPLEKVRWATETQISTIAHLLGKPRKFSKREGLTQLAALASGTDSQGRVNPSVVVTRARITYDRVFERLHDEIMVIDPRIEARQKTLANLIQLTELRLDGVDDLLNRLLGRDGLRPVFHDRRHLTIAAQLEYYAQDLEGIDFRPYRDACLETARDLREVRDRLRQREFDSKGLGRIRLLLVKCRSAIAIKRAQLEIERQIFKLTRLLEEKHRVPPLLGSLSKSVDAVLEKLEDLEVKIRGIRELEFRVPVCEAGAEKVAAAREQLLEYSRTDYLTLKGRLKETLGSVRETLKAASAAL